MVQNALSAFVLTAIFRAPKVAAWVGDWGNIQTDQIVLSREAEMAEPVKAGIGPWAASTISAQDVEAVAKTYVDWLGHRIVDRLDVADDLAKSWGTPAMAGRNVILLAPESGKEVLLRVVENEIHPDYKPLTSYGWASSELVVQDVNAVQERLRDSPFKIIGPAADLEMIPEIRAMQVVGLAGEVFYLTMFQGPLPDYDLPVPHSFVDRMFIAVLATDGPSKVQDWYHKQYGIEPGEVADIKLELLDDAFGFKPREGDYGLTVITLQGRSLIEVDRYPPQAVPRPTNEGCLPPGTAMMSVLVETLDVPGLNFLSDPIQRFEAPYHGRRSATLKGAMGELLELIEREAS